MAILYKRNILNMVLWSMIIIVYAATSSYIFVKTEISFFFKKTTLHIQTHLNYYSVLFDIFKCYKILLKRGFRWKLDKYLSVLSRRFCKDLLIEQNVWKNKLAFLNSVVFFSLLVRCPLMTSRKFNSSPLFPLLWLKLCR